MFEHVLSVMIFLPLLAGAALLLLPISKSGVRAFGLVVSVVVLICGLKVYVDFSGSGGLEFVEKISWVPSFGIAYHVGVDGISLFVLMVAAVLFPMVFMLFAEKSKNYYCNLLIALGAMVGAVVAADLVVFYVFWEVMLLPIFFVIGLYGGEQRIAATIKITLYTIAGSLLMLAGLLYIAVAHHAQTGQWSFEIARMASLDLGGGFAVAAFIGMMLAFAIKIPLFPFHTWLPDAYTEAPTSTTFILSAIMAKIGVYGVIRFVVPVFEAEMARFAVILAYCGVIGLMYCGIAAIVQKDFKRMLAFSSASHMGIIALGVFCMNVQALTGTLFQIVAHATSTGVLFLFAGILEERCQTRKIADLGGVAAKAPIFATFFAIAMLASCGLPGTSGFIGEFLIILGAVKFNIVIGVLAGTTLIIGVCYMLWMFQRVFFEQSTAKTAGFKDLSAYETLVFIPVILLILFMGIYPQPFIDKIEPAAQRQILQMATTTQPQLAGDMESAYTLELINN
ncbi:MAG: NuoM family protein [Desulfopila sp.]